MVSKKILSKVERTKGMAIVVATIRKQHRT